MNIPRIVDFQKYRHIWCFGCSFTHYKWPTWADHLAKKYPATNLGRSGAGNQYIFHQLIRKKREGKILPQDLVMICWTSFFRESRQLGESWLNPGNLWTQQTYGKEFLLKFCDPKALFLRDLDLIEATQKVISDHCDLIEFSMAPVGLLNQKDNKKLSENLYQKQITQNWLPSFYEVLWGGDITSITKSRKDPHPTTEEHKIYLKKVFDLDCT